MMDEMPENDHWLKIKSLIDQSIGRHQKEKLIDFEFYIDSLIYLRDYYDEICREDLFGDETPLSKKAYNYLSDIIKTEKQSIIQT